jgi:hypothetical protein
MLKASDILYTSWEDIPLRKVKVILQVLPLIKWDQHRSESNTYLKNFLLKQLFRSKKIYLQTTAEQRVDLFTYDITWVKEFGTTFPIKAYNIGGTMYHAPETQLTDLSVERLMEADIALFRFIRSEKTSYLDHFLAMLYTSKGFDSAQPDRRVTLSVSTENLSKQIPTHESIAIIRSFIGSFDLLRKQCRTLFPVIASDEGAKQSPKTAKDRSSPRSEDPARAWQRLLFEIANTPGYPGMEAAKNALAWEALPYMNHEQEKIQRESERLKNSGSKV